MAFKSIKKALESIALAASLSLAPAAANADNTRLEAAPHRLWIDENKTEARIAVLGADVVFVCLMSGIGSRINDNGFWNGCAKGSLAGMVTFAGEYIASYNNYPMFGAAGKLVHDAGISAQDNVMRGEPALSQYQTDIGPVTMTFRGSIVPTDYYITALPIGAIAGNLIKGQELDLKNSLYNLTPVFKMRNMMMNGTVDGYTIGNVISYYPDRFSGSSVLSHEFNHALFWSKMKFCGDLLHPVPYMKDIEKLWNVGQDLCYGMINLPMAIDNKAYPFQPHELEAFSMERSSKDY